MEVMHALGLLAWVSERIQGLEERGWKTNMVPTLNMRTRPIFFRVFMCRPRSAGMGRPRMMRSSTTEMAPLA